MAWHAKQTGNATLGVYWPLRGEPDLHEAYAQLAQAGVPLALPVVLEREASLAFASWAPGEAMGKDSMGVTVPMDLRLVQLPTIIVVPCLGFNDQNFRLGYGGGFYDRTLAATPRPYTVGVSYASQRTRFDNAPHDIALDLILT